MTKSKTLEQYNLDESIAINNANMTKKGDRAGLDCLLFSLIALKYCFIKIFLTELSMPGKIKKVFYLPLRSIKPDGRTRRHYVRYLLGRGWAGKNGLLRLKPAHPIFFYLFRAIDASGGPLFVKSGAKTFYLFGRFILRCLI